MFSNLSRGVLAGFALLTGILTITQAQGAAPPPNAQSKHIVKAFKAMPCAVRRGRNRI